MIRNGYYYRYRRTWRLSRKDEDYCASGGGGVGMNEIPSPQSINWRHVTKEIHVKCTALIDIKFDRSSPPFEIPKGSAFSGVYLGCAENSEDKIFRPYFQLEGRDGICGIQPHIFTVTLIDSRYCFRCGIHYPLSEFQRSPRIIDKSPILFHVCSTCYKKVKNKVSEHGHIANRYGGANTLKASEWLEILLASEGKCHYCKDQIGYANLVMEHMDPLSLKGGHTHENVVPACNGCNSSKGVRDVEDWQKSLENYRLMKHLQNHLNMSKLEVTNLAIRLLAEHEGLLEDDVTEAAS